MSTPLSRSPMNSSQLFTTSPIPPTPTVLCLIRLVSGRLVPILSAPIAASMLMPRKSAFMCKSQIMPTVSMANVCSENHLSIIKPSTARSYLSFKIPNYTASSPFPTSSMHPPLRLPPSPKSPNNKALTRSSHPAARNAEQRICFRSSTRGEKFRIFEGRKSLSVSDSLTPQSYLTAI